MTRAKRLSLAVAPTLRATRWGPLAAGASGGAALVHVAHGGVRATQFAAVALCVGAAFVLDDAAAATIAPTPLSLPVRRLLRPMGAVAGVAAAWAPLAAYAALLEPKLDVGRLTLELAALLALALAAAAARGGLLAAGIVALVFAAGRGIPPPYSLLDGSDAALRNLWALLALGGAWFVYASLDPGRARIGRSLRGAARGTRPTPHSTGVGCGS